MLTIARKFTFNAAHRLCETVPEGHPCSRIHGHTYHGQVTIATTCEPHEFGGMLVDFSVLKRVIREEIEDFYDHRFLVNKAQMSELDAVILPMDPTVEYMTYLSTIKMYFGLKRAVPEETLKLITSISVLMFETEKSWGEYKLELPPLSEENLIAELKKVKR